VVEKGRNQLMILLMGKETRRDSYQFIESAVKNEWSFSFVQTKDIRLSNC